MRFPAVFVGVHEDGGTCTHANSEQWSQPWMLDINGCSEHPDFPAYVASMTPAVPRENADNG
jgi:hypothetical protein